MRTVAACADCGHPLYAPESQARGRCTACFTRDYPDMPDEARWPVCPICANERSTLTPDTDVCHRCAWTVLRKLAV